MLEMSAKCTRGELVRFYGVSKHEEEYDWVVL